MKTTLLVALLVCLSTTSACLTGETQEGSAAAVADGTSNNASNAAPVITGYPDAAVLAGDDYSFAPSAADPDGDSLVFSIANKPRWAQFDSKTGNLSGQTTLGDIGTYDNILISVSDGNASQSLPQFSITVTQVGVGSMSLSWTPPAENTDGTPLTDLAGYRLYFGKSTGSYDRSIQIDNPSVSTYRIENLVPDTYYVVVTSFDATGVESAYSGEAVKVVSSN